MVEGYLKLLSWGLQLPMDKAILVAAGAPAFPAQRTCSSSSSSSFGGFMPWPGVGGVRLQIHAESVVTAPCLASPTLAAFLSTRTRAGYGKRPSAVGRLGKKSSLPGGIWEAITEKETFELF